jgi:hypothetical protein
VLNQTNVATHCEGVSSLGSAWGVIPIGPKDVEVLVVKKSVVGIPIMVVGAAVRVVIPVSEALKVWVLLVGLKNGAVDASLAKT